MGVYTAWSVVFGEQPTAAKWNQLGTNDAGFKDGSNIDDGVILERHIPDSELTPEKISALFQTTSMSGNTNSTSTVDLTGSITMSLPAGTFDVLVLGRGDIYNNSAGGSTQLHIYKDASALTTSQYTAGTGDNDKPKPWSVIKMTTAVNGTVFKPRCNVSGGTFGGFTGSNNELIVIVIGKQ